jgi:hypothetical protein
MTPVRLRRFPWSGSGVLALVLALVGGVAAAMPAVAAPAPATSSAPPGASTDAGASARAAATGQPVEVLDRRTETGTVTANPDGTFTSRENARPVRVRRGVDWVPVDATLSRRSDGTVAPTATSMPMAFSGGGTGPLVRVGRDGGRLDLSWPGTLPAPVLDGPTARYVDVRPGIDLVLTADALGFSQLVIVKNATAAVDPALATLRFGARADGLSVRADGGGNLTAADRFGTPMLHAPAAEMWDSAEPASPARGDGDRARTLPVRVADGEIAVVPDPAALAGPGVRYPVAIDPSFYAPGRTAWTSVWKQHPTTSYYNAADVARVGYETDTGQTVRSMFRYNTAPVAGKTVLSATLRTYLEYSWSCGARPVQLYRTSSFGPSTTWGAQPTRLELITTVSAAKGYPGCNPGGVDFPATTTVRNNATAGNPSIYLQLAAQDETDEFGWKKFRNNPVLEITYNTTPAVPSALSTYPNLACRTGASRPVIGPSSSRTARLVATVADADKNNVQAHFEWYRLGSSTKVGEFTTGSKASGLQHIADIPANTYLTGQTINWRVRSYDGTAWSAFSGWCEVGVDLTPPANPPDVSSTVHPESPVEGTSGGVGRPAPFLFGPNNVPDVASYSYQLTGGPVVTVPADGPGRTKAVSITPPEDRLPTTTLSVTSKDGGGNPSGVRAYSFYVQGPTGPLARWTLDEQSGTTLQSTTGTHGATMSPGVVGTSGRVDRAVAFGGVRHASTAAKVVTTNSSFTVSAWVKLANRTGYQTAVAQSGSQNSAFYLQYVPGPADRWRFGTTTQDTTSAGFQGVGSLQAPVLGVWTHLAGVYDVSAGTVRLYVDGVLQGETASAPWNATGPLQLGRALNGGVPTNAWSGDLDDVRVWDRVVYPTTLNGGMSDELHALANQPYLTQSLWRLDDGVGSTGLDGGAFARPLTLGSTAGWGEGYDGGALSLNGTAGSYAATPAPVLRTDRSWSVSAWVNLPSATGDHAVVSQWGSRESGFVLQYLGGLQQWALEAYSADTDTSTTTRATVAGPVAAAEWTHVLGIYDGARQELRICVNGNWAGCGVASYTAAWHATGGLQLGRTRHRGQTYNQLIGRVDGVQTFTGALTEQQTYDLFVLGAL